MTLTHVYIYMLHKVKVAKVETVTPKKLICPTFFFFSGLTKDYEAYKMLHLGCIILTPDQAYMYMYLIR